MLTNNVDTTADSEIYQRGIGGSKRGTKDLPPLCPIYFIFQKF